MGNENSMLTDGDPFIGNIDIALDATVDKQWARAADLPFDKLSLADFYLFRRVRAQIVAIVDRPLAPQGGSR